MSNLINQNGTWVVGDDLNPSSFDLDFIDLTDGSWNFIDINNSISGSVVFEDNANKVVTNAISAGTVNQLANSAQNVPRWYKNLVDNDGVQLTTGDNFIFIATIQALSSSNPAPFGFGCGISVNPVGTGSNANIDCDQGSGFEQGWMLTFLTNKQVTSNTGEQHKYDCNIVAGGAATVSNLLTSSVVTYINNFGNTNGAGSIAFNNIDNRLSRNNLSINPTNSNLFLQVGFGARQNTTSALSGAEHKQKIKFKVIRLSNK
jgi:hypothetical protein